MNIDPNKEYGSWSGSQIAGFLATARIPLRLSLMTSKGMLIVPLWFEYLDNRLRSCSPEGSHLVRSLVQHPDVAFDLSTNDLPYRGIRGRGVARCSRAKDNAPLERLLQRYLTSTDNKLAQRLLSRTEPEAVIEIEIEWLTSWDFSSRMQRIDPITDRMPEAHL